MDVCEIARTASFVGMPVCSRLRVCVGRRERLFRRGEPDSGHITRESPNARLRQCASSDGDFAGLRSGTVHGIRSIDTSNHHSV